MSGKCKECGRLQAIYVDAAVRYLDFYGEVGLLTTEAQKKAIPLHARWIETGRILDKHERTHSKKKRKIVEPRTRR